MYAPYCALNKTFHCELLKRFAEELGDGLHWDERGQSNVNACYASGKCELYSWPDPATLDYPDRRAKGG